MIEDEYILRLRLPSDVAGHLPTLRRLSVGHVAEFGTRDGVSTVGLIAGRPRSVACYDRNPCPRITHLRSLAQDAGVPLTHSLADTATLEMPEVDFLFIDTYHTAAQLRAELSRHHSRVRGRIALHDTETYGEVGEDGGPGLTVALSEFLDQHRDWRVSERHRHCNGLTIISKIRPVQAVVHLV